jgi:RNA-directed DNA polymerase
LRGRITKSILMAYSKNAKADFIFKKQILEKYSHLGGRNFLKYALNASKKEYKNSKGVIRDGMDSKSVRRQISSHFTILTKEIDKTSRQRAFMKMKKGNALIIKT